MPKTRRTTIANWRRLNLLTPKEMLAPDELALVENFTLRRGGALRLRPGYARFRGATPQRVQSQVFTEDFNSFSNGDNIEDDANWTGWFTNPQHLEVQSGEATIAAAALNTQGAVGYSASSVQADQYAEVTFKTLGGNNKNLGPAVRINSLGCYTALINNTTVTLASITGNGVTVTTYGGIAMITSLVDGDVIGVEAVGQQVSMYYNGVLVATVAGDTDHASGQPGIYSSFLAAGTNPFVDDFACGTVEYEVLLGLEVSGTPGRAFHFERDDGVVVALVEHGGKINAFRVGEREWTS